MRNQPIYVVNGRPVVRVIHQAPYPSPYSQQNYYVPQPSQFMPQPAMRMEASEGMEVEEEYEAQAGDPIVIEQVIFKGEVVQLGIKQKEVISENQAIISSEGYASEDGKFWKPIPRIMMTVFKVGQIPIERVSKIKAKFQSSLPNTKVMKICCGKEEYYLGFKNNVFNEWFLRLVWGKLMIDRKEIEQYGNWGSSISGRVLKKSEILGNWEGRQVRIDRGVLYSAKDQTSSASLQIKETKQIWTRFQQINGGSLVVKILYGIIKEEFAIPYRESIRWLYHFLTIFKLA